MDPVDFLERTTVRELLNVAPAALACARQLAHQLYRAGRLAEADVICRGLIACDHRLAWTYSLYAAVLRRRGAPEQALAVAERGLVYAPDHVKLRSMRDELRAALAAPGPAARPPVRPAAVAVTDQRAGAQRSASRTDSDP